MTVMGNRFDRVENELEELSIQMMVILRGCKEKGIIGEKEYKKHTEHKKGFLMYLDNKRKGNSCKPKQL